MSRNTDRFDIANSEIDYLIDQWIRNERDRAILKDRLINGMTFERLAEKHDKEDFQEFSVSGLCYLLLKIRKLTRGTASDKLSTTVTKSIQTSVKYVNEHPNEDLSVAALAEKCGISVEYYCRMFKSFTGSTPTGYINALRISRACDLLQKNPDRKIEEISRECGFNYITYFNKIFKSSIEYFVCHCMPCI